MPPEQWVLGARSLGIKYIRLGCVQLRDDNRGRIYANVTLLNHPSDLNYIKALYESKVWDIELEVKMKHRCITLGRVDMFEYFQSVGLKFDRTEIYSIIDASRIELLRRVAPDELAQSEYLLYAVHSGWLEAVQTIHALGVPFTEEMYLCSLKFDHPAIKNMIAASLHGKCV